jgi:chromosome segregation ATPase
MSCAKQNTKTTEYKKVSYKRKNGKKVSYCKKYKKKSIVNPPPCMEDYIEVERTNKRGTTKYCRKKSNILELRQQLSKLQTLQSQLIEELKLRGPVNKNEEKLQEILYRVSNQKDALLNRVNEQKKVIDKMKRDGEDVKKLVLKMDNDKKELRKLNEQLKNNVGAPLKKAVSEIQRLKDALQSVAQEKQEVEQKLIEEKNKENTNINQELGDIKNQLQTCNTDKQNTVKQLQTIEKDRNLLLQVRDALRGRVIELETKLNNEQKKLLEESGKCTYDKNILLQKLRIIENDRNKYKELEGKEKVEAENKLGQLIKTEDSIKEQLRKQEENCNGKLAELQSKLNKSENDLKMCEQKMLISEEKIEETKLMEEEIKKQLEDCSQRNLILTTEVEKSKQDIINLKADLESKNRESNDYKNLVKRTEERYNISKKEVFRCEAKAKDIKEKYNECQNKITQLEGVQEEFKQRGLQTSNDKLIEQLTNDAIKLKESYSKINESYKNFIKQFNECQDQLRKSTRDYDDVKEERDRLQLQLTNLQEQIKTLSEENKNKDQIILKLQENLERVDKSYKVMKKHFIRVSNKEKEEPVAKILDEKGENVVAVVNKEREVEAISSIPDAPPLDFLPNVEFESKKAEKQVLKKVKTGEFKQAPKATQNLLENIKAGVKLRKIEICKTGYMWNNTTNTCEPTVQKSILGQSLQEQLREKFGKRRTSIEGEEEEEEEKFFED